MWCCHNCSQEYIICKHIMFTIHTVERITSAIELIAVEIYLASNHLLMVQSLTNFICLIFPAVQTSRTIMSAVR